MSNNSQSHVRDARQRSAPASHPTPDVSPPPAGPIAAPSPVLSSIGLFVLLVAASLPFIDFYIVNVALPTIDSTLHASAPALELVVAGYGTAYALLLIVGGRLGDAYGRRRVFTLGLIGFTVTSLICGLAPGIWALVGARVAQGIAGALIIPQVLATFHATLDGPRQAKAIGSYGATIGVSTVAGQLIGGILVTADIAGATWRPVFLVNVPIGLIVIIAAPYLIPETRSPRHASVDLLGTGLFGLTIISLLVPLTEGQSLGWPLWTWLVLAVSPLAAVATYRAERSSERRGGSPLLPPSLLGLPSMRRGLGLGLPFFLELGGFLFVISLTVQTGLHQDAIVSGLVVAPLGVLYLAGSVLTPRLIARYGRSVMTAGGVLAALGLASLVVNVTTTWPHVNLFAFVPGMAAVGLGNSLIAVPLNRLLLADVPPERAGIGGGVTVTLQQTGYALGVATLGTLFISTEPHHIAGGFGWAVGISAAVAVFIAIGSFALPRLPVSPGPAPTASAVE